MLKSVSKLRKKLEEDTAGDFDFVFTTCPEQHGFRAGATIENYEAIADEIEKEVSDRYMELPLDADGVTVHFGDVLSQFGKPMRVLALTDPNEIDAMANIISDGDYGDRDWVRLRKMRHYHAPTVEDVLREFYVLAVRGREAHAEDVDEDVLAEYAQRLQLREADE